MIYFLIFAISTICTALKRKNWFQTKATFRMTPRPVDTRWYHIPRDIGYQLGLCWNPRVPLYRVWYAVLMRAGISRNTSRRGVGTDRARKVSIWMSEREDTPVESDRHALLMSICHIAISNWNLSLLVLLV